MPLAADAVSRLVAVSRNISSVPIIMVPVPIRWAFS